MAGLTYWLVVLGSGSFSLGRGPTWRAGAHPIDAETAQEVLAWKAKHAPTATWLAVLDHEPDLISGSRTGTFGPDDLRRGTQSGVRFRSPPASDPLPEPTPDDPEPPPTLFLCDFCDAPFPSSARLNRHVRAHHVLEHARTEERLRAQFADEQEARAAERRVEDAHPADLRPEERPDDPPLATIPLTPADQLDYLTGDL